MTQENILFSAENGEALFVAGELLASGRSYQIIRVATPDGQAQGTADDAVLCARAALYDTERMADKAYVTGRNQAMKTEWEMLQQLDHPLLVQPVAFFHVKTGEENFDYEPVLVCQWREGLTLFEWVRRKHPEGYDAHQALELFAEITDFLGAMHQAGYLWRDLDPRHFIVEDGDDTAPARLLGVVGFGNATLIGKRPNPHRQQYTDSPYVAPEIRDDLSGDLLRPSADVYGLGALMSFVLTGEEPRAVVENPLSHTAYERLSNIDPPGLSLLIARLIQPFAKNRVGRMDKLAKFLTAENLPTRHTPEFGMLLLPAPFSGVEDPKTNRSLQSKLSPGPLISVEHGTADKPPVIPEEPLVTPHTGALTMPVSWAVGSVVLGLVSVAVLIACGII